MVLLPVSRQGLDVQQPRQALPFQRLEGKNFQHYFWTLHGSRLVRGQVNVAGQFTDPVLGVF